MLNTGNLAKFGNLSKPVDAIKLGKNLDQSASDVTWQSVVVASKEKKHADAKAALFALDLSTVAAGTYTSANWKNNAALPFVKSKVAPKQIALNGDDLKFFLYSRESLGKKESYQGADAGRFKSLLGKLFARSGSVHIAWTPEMLAALGDLVVKDSAFWANFRQEVQTGAASVPVGIFLWSVVYYCACA